MNSTRDQVLQLLLNCPGEFVSGATISRELNLTRAAVWKQIETLKKEGYGIQGVRNKGYRLHTMSNKLDETRVSHALNTRELGRLIVTKESTASTNEDAHMLSLKGAKSGTVVIAEEQTKGRGRRRRSWYSAPGEGVYLSIILRPSISPSMAPRFTIAAALGLLESVRHFGVEAELKWPNDVHVQGRKLSGILLELIATMEEVQALIVGIGVNLYQTKFPEEIEGIATSIALVTGNRVDKNEFVADLLNCLEPKFDACTTDQGFLKLKQEYRENLATLSKPVRITGAAGEIIEGIAVDIDEAGHLIIEEGSKRRTVYSGDVSLRSVQG